MKYPLGFSGKIALFLAAWLGGLELFCRAFLVSPSTVIPDHELGWMFRPNSSARIETSEAGFRRISVNELGLNDWPIGPKGRRTRILVLGDSYVEAFQVPRPENFLGLLGRMNPDLQFVNGGRSGLDPASESVMLDKLGPRTQPDAVIMVVNDGDRSDLLADSIEVSRCANSRLICGYRAPPPSTHSEFEWRLLRIGDYSALLTYLLRRFHAPVMDEVHAVAAELHAGASPHNAAIPPAAYRRSDFEPFLAFIFRHIVQHHPLLVVAVPDTEFGPDGTTSSPDRGALVRSVAQASKEAGAEYLDAGPILAAAYARDRQPPRGFDYSIPGKGHLNAAGHAALAEALRARLATLHGAPPG